MKISIIIPVLNEEANLSRLLPYLKQNATSANISEIIVVDGGSTDASISQAKKENVTVISSEKGRAKQLNNGAQKATGNILYFLHADSFPPPGFDHYIINAVKNGNQAGCFRLRFDSGHYWLKLAGWLTRFNLLCCRGGDQSQFISKELFEEIGGYDESYTIYEDNILISQLYKRKKFIVLPKSLKTSARLYKKKGVWNLQYHFWMIHLKKRLGAGGDELYRYYLANIQSVGKSSEKINSGE